MKLKLFLISFLTFLIFVPLVSAQTSTPTSVGSQKREGANIKVEFKKGEVNQKITAIRRERIQNFSNKMIVRLEATIERIQKLIDRIGSRITKIDASDTEGKINTAKAKTDIGKAKLMLTGVKTKLSSLSIDDILVSNTPQEDFKLVRDSIKSIKNNLKEIHKLLVQTVGDLKGLRVGDTK